MLERSLLGLQRYVCAYACKGAATTEDLIKVYKMLLETSGESANVRSLAQRLLLKTVGMVDVPAAAADLMLSGGKLCRSTRHIHRVGLSGYRSLKKKAGADGVATNDNPLDRFLGRKIPLGLDAVYVSKMSLWEWATECANVKNCSCGRPHAPFFTGKPMLPSWPPTEEYALGQLMIHAQGTWRKIDELKWAQADGSVAVPGTLLPDGSLAAGADTFVDAFLKCFGLDGAPETLQAPGHVGGPTEDLEERGFPRRAQMVRELTLASKEKSERAGARGSSRSGRRRRRRGSRRRARVASSNRTARRRRRRTTMTSARLARTTTSRRPHCCGRARRRATRSTGMWRRSRCRAWRTAIGTNMPRRASAVCGRTTRRRGSSR